MPKLGRLAPRLSHVISDNLAPACNRGKGKAEQGLFAKGHDLANVLTDAVLADWITRPD